MLNGLRKHPVKGVPGLVKAQWQAGSRIASGAAGAAKLSPKLVSAARFVPVLGSVAAIGMAANSFSKGDYIGGTLNSIGAIPGPVGWAALGAGFLWNTFGKDDIGLWAAPDGTATFMLPAAAQDIAGVVDADMALTSTQRELYAFQDGPNGRVWDSRPPDALELSTAAVQKAAQDWLNGLAELSTTADQQLQSTGEPYFEQYRAQLAPHFQALADLTPACQALLTQLGEVDAATAAAYNALLEANRSLRMQLSENGELSDAGPAAALTSTLAAASSTITAANDRIVSAFPAAPAPLMPASGVIGGSRKLGSDNAAPAGPPAAAPAALAPAGGGGAPARPVESDKKSDDLSKFLDGLGQQKSPLGGNPMGGNPLGGMGGGTPMGGGNPLGGGTPMGAGQGGRRLDDDDRDRRLGARGDRRLDDRDRKPQEEKAERKLSAATPDNRTTAPAAAGLAPAAGPATAGAPATAPGRPADPAAAKGPTEVTVKGEKVEFPPGSEKTAKMAQLLAEASPQQPMSLADAAAKAGLTPPVPGQDPGRQVQPVDAKPGDVLVTDGKSFMLLGEGRFYDLQEFKTVGATDLPQDAGSRGGYFSLIDPAAPGGGGGGGGTPVSPPPADPVAFDVPGGQPPPQTVDASVAPPDPVDTPEADQPPGGGAAPPAPTAGVASAGAPGVPAAGNGGGPANAADTATGTGTPMPSTNAAPLDPSAVR